MRPSTSLIAKESFGIFTPMPLLKDKNKHKVLVILNGNLKSDQDHISGILRYGDTHPEWDVFLMSDHPSNRIFSDVSEWNPDGIIVSDYAIELGLLPAPKQKTKAIVAVMSSRTDSPFPNFRFASVNLDNRQIGKTAAEFLLRKGFRNFAFIGTPHVRKWSDDRLAGFKEELSKSGYDCISLGISAWTKSPPGWKDEQERLAKWLLSLPKPCGIMASYDQRAKHILDMSRILNISIPGQIGVISVDNEEFLCEHTHPTLTSIVPDFISCGYRAAELLDTLMNGGKSPNAPEFFGVKGIVERFSTADFSGSARIVETAREFMRLNYSADISLNDIADAAGVSVRLLEKRFQAISEKSPSEELRDIRLNHVKNLLRKTHTPIKEISWLCGFKSEIHLKNLFRSKIGISMSKWRQENGG